jgi:hypothetical protein
VRAPRLYADRFKLYPADYSFLGASPRLSSGSGYSRSPALFVIAAFAMLLITTPRASAEIPDDEPTIEALLKGGWQIAGYTGAVDNWSTFILFRHADEPYLVQCRAGYDATREPHIKPHCYKLR